MPQLDFSTYPNQVVWLLLCFILLFVFSSYYFVPKVEQVIKKREQSVKKHLKSAEEYVSKCEVTAVKNKRVLSEAYSVAQNILNDAFLEVSQFDDDSQKQFVKDLKKMRVKYIDKANELKYPNLDTITDDQLVPILQIYYKYLTGEEFKNPSPAVKAKLLENIKALLSTVSPENVF